MPREHAPRPCPACQGRRGEYVTESRDAGNGQTVDSKAWQPCGTCGGSGTVR